MHLNREALRAAPSIQHVCIIRVDFEFSPLKNFFSDLHLASCLRNEKIRSSFISFPQNEIFLKPKRYKWAYLFLHPFRPPSLSVFLFGRGSPLRREHQTRHWAESPRKGGERGISGLPWRGGGKSDAPTQCLSGAAFVYIGGVATRVFFLQYNF